MKRENLRVVVVQFVAAILPFVYFLDNAMPADCEYTVANVNNEKSMETSLFTDYLMKSLIVLSSSVSEGSHHSLGLFVAFEEDEGRDVLNAEGLADVLSLVNVHLVYDELTFVFFGEAFGCGFQLHAGAAPLSVEIHHARRFSLVAETFFIVYFRDFLDEFRRCEEMTLPEVFFEHWGIFSLGGRNVQIF